MPDLSSATWSETDDSNSAPPPNGWPEGQSPSSVNDCARMMMGAMKRFWNRLNATVVSSGAANLFAVSYAVAPAAYVLGERFTFKAHQANTGAAIFSVNGLSGKSILKPGPSGPAPLTGGEVQPGQVVSLAYDGTQFVMISPAANQIPASRTIASGNGLTGGGDLSVDRTLAVGAGTGIVSNADDVAIDKATQANMEAQTANKVVTADNMKWHPGMPKAWAFVAISGGTPTIAASYGVSSITRNAAGDYTLTVSSAFSSTTAFAVIATLQHTDSSSSTQSIKENASRTRSTTQFHLLAENAADGVNTDPTGFSVMVLGDLG